MDVAVVVVVPDSGVADSGVAVAAVVLTCCFFWLQ